jgi:hypothetical protein
MDKQANRIGFMKKLSAVKGIGAIAAAVSLFIPTQVQAVIAFNFPQLNGNQSYSGALTLGETFTVNSPININALAAYDDPANGSGIFGGAVNVAIYQVSLSGNTINGGTLAISPLSFSTATPGSLISGTTTREQLLGSPVQLAAGTYMIVANNYGGAAGTENNWNRNTYVGSPVPSANTGAGALTWGANYYFLGNVNYANPFPTGIAWHYDDVNNPGNNWHPRYMAGNFDFTPVPEVAAFGAASVGLLGLVFIGRYVGQRRRMKLA